MCHHGQHVTGCVSGCRYNWGAYMIVGALVTLWMCLTLRARVTDAEKGGCRTSQDEALSTEGVNAHCALQSLWNILDKRGRGGLQLGDRLLGTQASVCRGAVPWVL